MTLHAKVGKSFLYRPSDQIDNYSIKGTIPPGLVFDPIFGSLRGKPTKKGIYSLRITRFKQRYVFIIDVRKKKICPLVYKSVGAEGWNYTESSSSEIHVFFKGDVENLLKQTSISIHITCVETIDTIISYKFHPSPGTILILKSDHPYLSQSGPFHGTALIKDRDCKFVIPFSITFTNTLIAA